MCLLQASKTQFVNKVQQCFAVRAQVDSFLDVARATFARLTEAIHELAAKYRSGQAVRRICTAGQALHAASAYHALASSAAASRD